VHMTAVCMHGVWTLIVEKTQSTSQSSIHTFIFRINATILQTHFYTEHTSIVCIGTCGIQMGHTHAECAVGVVGWMYTTVQYVADVQDGT
jgi:hypothetical protein